MILNNCIYLLFRIIINNLLMKKTILIMMLVATAFSFSQEDEQLNIAQTQLLNLADLQSGLTIGGYGEINYNDFDTGPSELDVQRLVLLFAYKFDDRVSFITEIEYEHVKEVYIEQAWLNYALADNTNLRAGLLLVPMGIINEYHESTTFNGVERPTLDNKIVPTTWREIGMGIAGRIPEFSMRYQAYIMNGPISYNGSYKLKGTNGLRGGRQKGAESQGSDANFAARLDYFGLLGLRLGASYYTGKTQTTDTSIIGSQVGVNMLGLDARYVKNNFSARAQYINAVLSDTEKYNLAGDKDLGSKMGGYYLEAAYNVLPIEARQRLDLFVRYENLNQHKEVEGSLKKNLALHRKEWTLGASYHLSRGSVFKIDYQSKGTALEGSKAKGQFNMGIGIFF